MDPECREMFEKMQEYLDGDCDELTCREVEEHLKKCRHCEDCMDSINKTIEIIRKAAEEGIPKDIKLSLRKAIRECME